MMPARPHDPSPEPFRQLRTRWTRSLLAALLVALLLPAAPLPGQQGSGSSAERVADRASAAAYYPGANWERRAPEAVGMNARLLREAVDLAIASETQATRDLEALHPLTWGNEPFDDPIGPFRERGDPSGLVIRNGYIVAEWGDIRRVDVTYSVTKSFLSATVGLAWDRAMIRDVHHPVREYMPTPTEHFESEHNRKITWDHLLRQTSDWQGTLWGKPDWADRPSQDRSTWLTRERDEPGTAYKYNDVRVNLLALAALNVWRKPLPVVLREELMDPIHASNTWRWHGYENSWVELDGQKMQSVSGGAHWGGGMFISAEDMARFGYLTLRKGWWEDRQILSEAWMEMAETPTGPNPGYGFMNWFLNTDRATLPSAPESAFVHRGAGTNNVYVDRENDLVIVVRWIRGGPAMDGVVERVIASLGSPAGG